jgi:Holliday junction resolvase-like predicted endonuclease
MKTTKTSAIDFATTYFNDKHEKTRIIEENYQCEAGKVELVIEEDDTIAFVNVNLTEAAEMPEDDLSPKHRMLFESIAIDYLTSHNLPSCVVRFDIIQISLRDGRALLRHHRDAFASQG